MNKIAKAAQHSIFILIAFLILGRFPISALGVVLLLLLMDFVLISIATDQQPAGDAPAVWRLGQLTRVGLAFGIPGAAQMLALIVYSQRWYDLSDEESETLAWSVGRDTHTADAASDSERGRSGRARSSRRPHAALLCFSLSLFLVLCVSLLLQDGDVHVGHALRICGP